MMRLLLAVVALIACVSSSSFRHKNLMKAHLKNFSGFKNYAVKTVGAEPACRYILAVKYANPDCTGNTNNIVIIPNQCLVQFTNTGIATDIIYAPTSNGASVVRTVYSGKNGTCGGADSYVYADVLQPNVCNQGFKYSWNLTKPDCWVQWQEYDETTNCGASHLASTTYLEPNQCFLDKSGLTWGLQCGTTGAVTSLYQEASGACTGTPYGTYQNATCMNSFATGVEYKATYNCPKA